MRLHLKIQTDMPFTGIVTAYVGLSLIGLGALFWSIGGCPSWITSLLAGSGGALICWVAAHEWRRRWGLGKPAAELVEGELRWDRPVRIRFSQEVPPGTRFRLVGAIALREKLRGETRKKRCNATMGAYTYRDHAPQSSEAGEMVVGPSGRVEHEFSFTLPVLDLNEFDQQNRPVAWVFKVRFIRSDGREAYGASELPAATGPAPVVTGSQGGYSVTLLFGSKLDIVRVSEAISEVIPHLHQGEAGVLYLSAPCVILEDTSAQVAETVRRRLNAAGARVEVRYQGQLIEPPSAHNLPISSDHDQVKPSDLPVPSTCERNVTGDAVLRVDPAVVRPVPQRVPGVSPGSPATSEATEFAQEKQPVTDAPLRLTYRDGEHEVQ